MKVLLILSGLQTAGIAAILLLMLHQAEPSRREAAQPEKHGADAAISAEQQLQLRQLIREELAAAGRPVAVPSTSVQAPAPVAEVASDPARRAQVAQQIELYRSIGSIDDAQLQELQSQIMALDSASRKQMMSVLARALNAGEIKSRL